MSQIRAFSSFFGRSGIIDLLKLMAKDDFRQDAILKIWSRAYRKAKDGFFDYSLLQLYHRYLELSCLNGSEIELAENAIATLNSEALRDILHRHFDQFKDKVIETNGREVGDTFIRGAEERLFQAVQLSFFSTMEE